MKAKMVSIGKKGSILKILLFSIAIIFILFIGSLFFNSQKIGKSEETLIKGIEYYKNGKLDDALREVTKAVKSNPKSAEAHCVLGSVLDDKGDTEQAIFELTKAIEIDPNLSEAYYNRGNVYRKRGNFDEAILDYTKAIQIRPDYVNAYNNRGGTYNDKDEPHQAILDCTRAIEINPSYPFMRILIEPMPTVKSELRAKLFLTIRGQ